MDSSFARSKHPARDIIGSLRPGESTAFRPASDVERARIVRIVSNLRYSGRKDLWHRADLQDEGKLVVWREAAAPGDPESCVRQAGGAPLYSLTLQFTTNAELQAALRRLARED